MANERDDEPALSSETLAALIVDSLVDAGLVARPDFDRATTIAAEKIEIRKIMRDYCACQRI